MPTAENAKRTKTRQKHVPLRTCVVCRETSAKRTLIRIVRTDENSFDIDPTGRANGRGAYLCNQAQCWDKAASTPILARALRVAPDEASLERLRTFAATLIEAEGNATPAAGKEQAP